MRTPKESIEAINRILKDPAEVTISHVRKISGKPDWLQVAVLASAETWDQISELLGNAADSDRSLAWHFALEKVEKERDALKAKLEQAKELLRGCPEAAWEADRPNGRSHVGNHVADYVQKALAALEDKDG